MWVRWSRKPEVTGYMYMRTIPRVVWWCVQVENDSFFCIDIVISFIVIM